MLIPTQQNVIHIRLALAIAALLPACFHPTYDQPACGYGGECPAGMTCGLQGICEVPGDSSGTPLDASSDSSTDARVDAPGATPQASFTPSNRIDPTWSASLTGIVTISANTMFDADTGAISGGLTRAGITGEDSVIGYFQVPALGAGGSPLAVFTFHGLEIDHAATVVSTGTRAVVLLIGGSAVIDGTIDVAAGHANNWSPGPGGGAGGHGIVVADGCGGGNPGSRDSADDGGGAGGGAGGGGGRGGDAFTALGFPSAAGGGVRATCLPGELEPLQGGSGGGRGSGMFTTDFAPGGGGGGALQITALGSLVITGTIDAGGAGGESGSADEVDPGSGAGGGAGGAVLLESPSVMLSSAGAVAANGGGGGAGGSDFVGRPGEHAHVSTNPAAGGTSNATGGPGGGAGGASAFVASAGTDGGHDAAGGGGGVGAIVIRSRLSIVMGTTSPAAVELQLKPL